MKRLLIILIIWLLAIIPAQAQCEGHCGYLPIIAGGNPCQEIGMSDWKIIIPETTINKVLNPSAEIAGNFAAGGAATVTRVTTYQHYGIYSYRVQTTGNNEGIELTLDTLANAIHYVTLRVRGTLPAAWDWSLDNATYSAPTLLEAIDGTWSLYGLQFPAAQANGSTKLYIDQNGAGAGNFFIDGVQVEEKSYWTTYCDGTQPGCEWLGVAHGATSQRSANSRAGGRVYDLRDDYYLNIGGMAGVGVAPQALGVDEYAVLPGGELGNLKITSRVMTLTGVITGTTQANFHTRKQTLLDALSPDAYPEDEDGVQPVRLRYNGATVHKQIAVHYEGGLEGELSASEPCFWERVAVRFIAPQPYWEEIGESAAILDTSDSITTLVINARLRNTGQWDDLGPPNAAGSYTWIWAFEEDETYIYVAGDFTNFDNIANADYIVRWHKANQTWSALGTGTDGIIYALALGADGNLYAGGAFANAGGGAAAHVAVWDPGAGTWSALGAGTDDIVYTLAIGLDGILYASGPFLNAGGGGATRVASWNGAAWSALGAGLDNYGRGSTIGLDGTYYVIGAFLNAGGAGANYIASWDGSAWSPLGTGLNASGWAVTISPDGLLYAGGQFTTAGGSAALRIAIWNGTNWSPLGDGVNQQVYSLRFAPDGKLYACGLFTSAGGLALSDRMGFWNGSSWAHLDLDLPGAGAIVTIWPSEYTDPVIEKNYDVWIGHGTSGTATLAGLITATNAGTTPAYPKIIYSRSGGTSATIATLRNERDGREILFDYALLDGETLTIDLNPLKKSIISSIFGQRQDAILPNSDFGDWALLTGNNDVTSFVIAVGAPTITGYMLWKDTYKSQD